MTRQSNAISLCQQLLNQLGWTWEHPRVVDWLSRVGRHYTGVSYTRQTPIPEFVYVALAKYLDLRLKCDRTLQCLKWDWMHQKVQEVERRYKCVGQMPLKGYQELYETLDTLWWEESGNPF